MELHVAQADVSGLEVDAVVVPTSSMGEILANLETMLLAKAGPDVIKDLRAKAPVAIGAAIVAPGGEMAAREVILVPIVKYVDDAPASELLRRAVKAGLVAANVKGYRNIAIPPFLTQEKAGLTVAEAARAVVQEIQSHQKDLPENVYLVDPSDRMRRVFEDAIEHARHAL